MIEATIDSKGLMEKCRKTRLLFQNAEIQAVSMAYYYHTVLKARTPKHAGGTAESWNVRIHQKSEGTIIWEISPDGKEKEVTFLEFGTKPHVIEPKDSDGALRFEIGGEMIYAQKVYHPGTKPLGFVRMTQDDVDKDAKALGERLLQAIGTLWGT